MEKKSNVETINKVAAEVDEWKEVRSPNGSERRKRPEIKINKPFGVLAGIKLGK